MIQISRDLVELISIVFIALVALRNGIKIYSFESTFRKDWEDDTKEVKHISLIVLNIRVYEKSITVIK